MRGVVSITGGSFLREGELVKTGSDTLTRADDAFKELQTIRDNKEVITVVTSAKTYDSMILKSLTVPRDKSSGDSLVFSASFQEVIFADVETVTIDKIKPNKTAAPKKAGGDVAYEPLPESLQNFITDTEINLYGSAYSGPS